MDNQTQGQNQQIPPDQAIVRPAASTPSFKSATFGGFQKQSVLAYIYELNNSAQSTQDRLKAQIDEIAASREQLGRTVQELEQRLRATEGQVEGLQVDLTAERGRTTELSGMLERMTEEIERQKRIGSEKEDEILRFARVNEELREQNAELEKHKAEFERSSIIVGELIVRARGEAEEIIAQANEQAQGIMDEAGKQLVQVNAQFNLFKSEMENIEQRIESAVITMQRKFADIGEAIGQAEHNIAQSTTFQRREFTLVGEEEAMGIPQPVEAPQPEERTGEDTPGFFGNAAEI